MWEEEKQTLLQNAKLRLLQMHFEANAGHLGGNLSCLDIMMTLHHRVMRPEDRFILSKGHAAGALYVTLWSLGKISDAKLKTFSADDTLLPGHPSGVGIPDLLFATGSLGHGPSLAAGLALAAKHKGTNHTVYCLCSDGEWQEGSCWEALTFAVHNRLDNLVIIIDQNGLQGYGRTEDIISCSDLSPRIAAFGAAIERIDGHDLPAIETGLTLRHAARPLVVIAETVKGKGLYNAGLMESHYLPLTDEQYEAERARLAGERAR